MYDAFGSERSFVVVLCGVLCVSRQARAPWGCLFCSVRHGTLDPFLSPHTYTTRPEELLHKQYFYLYLLDKTGERKCTITCQKHVHSHANILCRVESSFIHVAETTSANVHVHVVCLKTSMDLSRMGDNQSVCSFFWQHNYFTYKRKILVK